MRKIEIEIPDNCYSRGQEPACEDATIWCHNEVYSVQCDRYNKKWSSKKYVIKPCKECIAATIKKEVAK